MHRYSYIFVVAIVFGLFVYPAPADASQVLFTHVSQEVSMRGDIVVHLVVDTEGRHLNAVEGSIVYPHDSLNLKEIQDGTSVLTFWTKQAAVGTDGSVHFAGIAPGGFRSEHAQILTLIFTARQPGVASVAFTDGSLLLHDGLGTVDTYSTKPLDLVIPEKNAGTMHPEIDTDDEIPEAFMPEIIQDDGMYDGDYTLIFKTEDKQSGISHYEVRETWLRGFERADSPYRIQHQKLDREITVRAVDRAGNVRIATLPALYPQPWYASVLGVVSVCALVLLMVIGYFWFRYMHVQK